MTAMMTCLVLLTTYTFKIPTPFQGYVHLGDAMIFLSVLVVGRKNGAVAAAFGSALADLLGGYVAFAPWTFVIKGLMALVMGWFIDFMTKKQSKSLKVCGVPLIEIVGMVIAGAVMVLGYGVADAVLAGNIMTQHACKLRTVRSGSGNCKCSCGGSLQNPGKEVFHIQTG